MIKKIAATVAVALSLLLQASLADAQSYNADKVNKATTGQSQRTVILAPDDNKVEQGLILRQQQRMNLFDADLKDLRGSLEQGFRTLEMQLEKLSSSTSTGESEISASIRSLQDDIERITDALAKTKRRMDNLLQFTTDVEFRLVRMEKRMQTLMTLGSQDLANAAGANSMLPAEPGEQTTIQRDNGDGTTDWSIDENKLNQQLDDTSAIAQKDTAKVSAEDPTQPAAVVVPLTDAEESAKSEEEAPIAKLEILPDEDPEEQYRFAFVSMMQSKLETAELAFAEFIKINAAHQKSSDAMYWLGRVQLQQTKYAESAQTFFDFISKFSEDERKIDATLYIAEAIPEFLSAEKSCEVFGQLEAVLDAPLPEKFTTKITNLRAASSCAN